MSHFTRSVHFGLCISAGLIAFTGCGSGRPSVGAFSALPQGRIPASTETGRSWMLAEAKYEDLVYTSDIKLNKVFVLSSPAGKLVGTLNFPDAPWGLCSDTGGNVFITRFLDDGGVGKVEEYRHGGSRPIATRSLPISASATCSVDPTTGDVAVTSGGNGEGYDNISIFSSPFEKGTPPRTITAPSTGTSVPYSAYDDRGNLFLMTLQYSVGWSLYRLAHGSSTLVPINVQGAYGALQWHGRYLCVGIPAIHHVKISRSNGTVVGVTTIFGKRDFHGNFGQFWNDGNTVAAPFNYPLRRQRRGQYFLGIWSYPSGSLVRIFHGFGAQDLVGVTISRKPKS
jgi:hypothetical protein